MLLPQKKKAGAKRADQCDAGCRSQKTGEPGGAPLAAVGPAGIVFIHIWKTPLCKFNPDFIIA
ncbi:MAG: hypothetical protein EGR22_00280 [Ruminococcaceae bacterium]|nr:hypothetical protein [Oscillospiraceae bacterium]